MFWSLSAALQTDATIMTSSVESRHAATVVSNHRSKARHARSHVLSGTLFWLLAMQATPNRTIGGKEEVMLVLMLMPTDVVISKT